MSPEPIRGVLPVLQTPFHDNGEIDYETLKAEIAWLFDQGVDGVVMGMVSEAPRLTDSERDCFIRAMVESSAGLGPAISSVGAESTVQAVRNIRSAEDVGIDAHMAIPPALTRISADEIKRYYEALVQAATKPIIVQDASGYLGNTIPISVQAELFRLFPGRIAFKPEAQPIGANLSALRDATEGKAAIYEGTGGIALVDSYRRGIAGTMPGSDLAWSIVALWKALGEDDEERIAAIQGPLVALISLQHNLDAFLAIEKLLLVHQGVFKNSLVRGPVGYDLDPETSTEVLRLFERLKLACAAGAPDNT